MNGAKLYVVVVGAGDPLIIIPGGPGGAHLGYRSFDSLAKDNQVIYFDAFGRGKSDTAKDVKEYTLARDIEDIEGFGWRCILIRSMCSGILMGAWSHRVMLLNIHHM